MRRREFICLIGGAAGWSLAARAQQSAKMRRIAFVHSAEKLGNMTIAGRRFFRAFFEELGKSGYVEGQNLLVERYSGEGRPDHFAELASEIVNTRPDLIVTVGGILARHFKGATTTIPIIAASSDPIISGLVPSLAHPASNITGVSVDAGIQIWGKRLELLREALPKLSNARFLTLQPGWETSSAILKFESYHAALSSL